MGLYTYMERDLEAKKNTYTHTQIFSPNTFIKTCFNRNLIHYFKRMFTQKGVNIINKGKTDWRYRNLNTTQM